MSIEAETIPARGSARYRNQAARRVLSVLSALGRATQPCGVSELARTLGMSKNMVHRALATLIQEGYVARDAGGQRYQLGHRVLMLGADEAGDFDIAAVSRPTLEALHALTGESVYLSIIVGASRVTIDEIVPPGPRVLRSLRGAQVPLHCTKMSRALLARLSDEEIDVYLKLAAPLARPLSFPDPASETPEAVWEDIRVLRAGDHVVWCNPHRSSAAHAIFPLLDESGRPHAIITVGGPRERFDIDRIEALLPEMLSLIEPLREHARRFSAPHPFFEGSIIASSARRALKVLEAMAASDRPLGVTEIARRLGLSPGTAFRTLDALLKSDYAERYQSSSRYVVGAAAARLRQSLFAQFRLRDAALPYLRQLASASGETGSLIVPLGWYALRVASARGSNEITNAAPLGLVGSLGQHYAGRAILAFAPDETVRRYLAWERLRGPARAAAGEIAAALPSLRARGFAEEETAFAKGRGALALPICDRGEAIAAIAIEGPVLDLRDPRPIAGAVEIVRGLEAAIRAHPKKFGNPFGHIDPDTIRFDQS